MRLFADDQKRIGAVAPQTAGTFEHDMLAGALKRALTARLWCRERYFTDTLACVATAFHTAMSSLMKAAKCSGVSPTVCIACASRSALVAGSCSAATIWSCSLAMIGGGVFAGAKIPCHAMASKPG